MQAKKIGTTKIYKDVGSGLNEKRPGLNRMIRDIKKGIIKIVVVEHCDRLTRFGRKFLEDHFSEHDVPVIYVGANENIGLQEQLVNDVMSLMASFSGKLYKLRAINRKKLNAANTLKGNNE